jgi:hypothetical protein
VETLYTPEQFRAFVRDQYDLIGIEVDPQHLWTYVYEPHGTDPGNAGNEDGLFMPGVYKAVQRNIDPRNPTAWTWRRNRPAPREMWQLSEDSDQEYQRPGEDAPYVEFAFTPKPEHFVTNEATFKAWIEEIYHVDDDDLRTHHGNFNKIN